MFHSIEIVTRSLTVCAGCIVHGCDGPWTNLDQIRINVTRTRNYTLNQCHLKCKHTRNCSNYRFRKDDRSGDCVLFKKGCYFDTNSDWDFYSLDQCEGNKS